MKKSFLNQSTPVITGIMAGQTPEEMIAEARNCEFEGAQGIAISLEDLKPEFRNRDSIKRVIDTVNLPFMFIFYRNDRWGKPSDDERQELLLEAADAGASIIDVMGDLYDPSPMELTRSQSAIDKQMRLIDKIHAKGADVIISSHMDCARSTAQVMEHLREVEKRGADVVKLVATTNTKEELSEAFLTTMTLKQELATPFVHLCNGKFSRPHRFLCPALGTSILFAIPRFEPRYGFIQPTIRSMKAVLENLNWDINDVYGLTE
ncbi:MAG: type I 3-dehydroquinate dehydratase [Planctomycetes bacterium]|nr:type I 3-dehydroquinate dehydratase [Planctomycetota bacterium]